jgi:6-pyruvoyltetrahydropterin/6-carboxytetrahydropterin synthase
LKLLVSRRLHFSAGHRLVGHEGACAFLHGHNYVVFVHANGQLDAVGRVIDFAVLKERVGGWIQENWDHGFIVAAHDTDARRALDAFTSGGLPQKTYVLDRNPTAENLAEYLALEVSPRVLHGTGVKVVRIVVQETENCTAECVVE